MTSEERLMKLETKLTSHIESNDKDFIDLKCTTTEIRASVYRIEEKQSLTAKKDDLDKVLAIAAAKADRTEVNLKADKDDVHILATDLAAVKDLLIKGIGVGILLSLISIGVSYFFNH